jgi:hypothetical protein
MRPRIFAASSHHSTRTAHTAAQKPLAVFISLEPKMALGDLFRNLGGLVKQARDLRGEADKLVREIESRKRERDEVRSKPLAREDVVRLVLGDIQRRREKYATALSTNIIALSSKPLTAEQVVQQHGVPILTAMPRVGEMAGLANVENAVFGLFGEQIEKAVVTAINQMPWPEAGLPLDKRALRLDELGQEIAALEKEQEELAGVLAALRG